ncbi:MAG: SRPBCC family protein [Pseudarcicella sp.]|nr:SRPBCC family protein [Pseudarcicella sp.]MBP6409709.1 SRPBCC family protein [Pseudarcicella sp.]
MKTLKIILSILLLIVVIALITALFVKKDYTVVRVVTINKPKTEVFNYLKYLKNQEQYSPWSKMDPNMKQSYKGTDATIGFTSIWEGDDNTVGSGEQEITKITEGEKIELELRFIKPFASTCQAFFSTDSLAQNETKVTWGMAGTSPYPTNLMNLFMNMDEMVGTEFKKGLDDMKEILEK